MNEKLEKLSKEFMDTMLKKIPYFATLEGIHDYDEEMPEGTLKDTEEIFTLQEKFYRDVKALDPGELDFEGKISRDALLNSLSVEIFQTKAHGVWKSHSEVGSAIGAAVSSLFLKEFAPLEERLERISARLEKTPRFLENSKEVLTDPVAVWVELAVNEIKGMKQYLRMIQETAREEQVREKTQSRLDNAAEKAVESLTDYERWLEVEKLPTARKEFAIGPDNFDKLIELRELDMSVDDIYRYGEEILDYSREKLREVAAKIAPHKNFAEVKRMMMENHPATFEEALLEGQKAVEQSRQFVIDSGYATLPGNEKLYLIETPHFARKTTPFGAYCPPGKYDKKQNGFYWMSPPSDENDPSGLEIHNQGAILNTSVHEGYPGHHLQLICANMNPSYARIFNHGTEFVEGWAHYCEEAVAEMGFRTELSVMFERYVDMVWRAARILVDVKLSRGEMGHDEAMDMLQEISGFDREPCKIEVDRYTFTPGYQLSYLIGKKKIMDLRKSVKEKAGADFNLKKFHDSMLYAGVLPFKYMEKTVNHAFGLNSVPTGV